MADKTEAKKPKTRDVTYRLVAVEGDVLIIGEADYENEAKAKKAAKDNMAVGTWCVARLSPLFSISLHESVRVRKV